MNKRTWLSFDTAAFGILFIALTLLPLVFFTWPGLSLDAGKKIFFLLALFISLILWLIGRLQENRLLFPKNGILVAAAFFAGAFLLAALTSGAVATSLVGLGYETGTFLSIISYVILVFLVGVLFQSKRRLLNFYLAISAAFLLVFSFQVVRIIWPLVTANPFPLNIFSISATNLIGKWNDLGVFAGLLTVSSLALLELLPVLSVRPLKIFFSLVLWLSLVTIALINFYLLWVVVGIFALLLFVYAVSFHDRLKTEEDEGPAGSRPSRVRVFRPAFLVLLIAILFIVLGREGKILQGAVNTFSQKVGISVLEVRPSWTGTNLIVKETLKTNPLLGAGPNRFVNQWLKFKPLSINQTPFWNIDFNSGVGLWPTWIVMTGAVGLAAMVFLLIMILWSGGRAFIYFRGDKVSRSLVLIVWLGLLYLITINFFYVSETVTVTLLFALIGLLVAVLGEVKFIKNKEISLLKDPRISFVSLLVFIFLLIAGVSTAYLVLERFRSVLVFQEALAAANQGNTTQAANQLNQAIRLSKNDLFYRTLAEVNLVQLAALAVRQDLLPEELNKQFADLYNTALTNAQSAVDFDRTDYANWLTLAHIYEFLVPPPFNVTGAYPKVVASYNQAGVLNPTSPEINLSLARLELARSNTTQAKKHLTDALNKKKNYTPAIFLLVQLETASGNIEGMIAQVKEAILLSPQTADIGLWFELGFLYYRHSDYQLATEALARAVALNENYSNARYFLGLSLDKLGDKAGAIEQFRRIEALNPENQEVKQIIQNLVAGRGALSGAPPLTPESRRDLPIKER